MDREIDEVYQKPLINHFAIRPLFIELPYDFVVINSTAQIQTFAEFFPKPIDALSSLPDSDDEEIIPLVWQGPTYNN